MESGEAKIYHVRLHKLFGEIDPDGGFSAGNLKIGLLAELADALDSKSATNPQNRSEKQRDSESPLSCFSTALTRIGLGWPNLAPEVRTLILRVVEASDTKK
jgi:hypothetical protein